MLKRNKHILLKLNELNSLFITHATTKRITGRAPDIGWLKGSNVISLNGEFSLYDLFQLLLIVNRLEENPLEIDRVLHRSI